MIKQFLATTKNSIWSV